MSDERERAPQITLSNDMRAIEKKDRKENLCDCRIQQLKANARSLPHKVKPQKKTTKFAWSEWDQSEHESRFYLTALIRQLWKEDRQLRETRFANHNLFLNAIDHPDFTTLLPGGTCSSIAWSHWESGFQMFRLFVKRVMVVEKIWVPHGRKIADGLLFRETAQFNQAAFENLCVAMDSMHIRT